MLGRAKPEQFAIYSTGSAIINCLNHGQPTRLRDKIMGNMYSMRQTQKKWISKQALKFNN